MISNFSWVIEGKLAGSGQIGGIWGGNRDEALAADLDALEIAGVSSIVSLTEFPLETARIFSSNMNYLHLPIPDMSAPTLDTIRKFVEFVDEELAANRPVLVHCGAGLGRTGTMLACYIVKTGISVDRAIDLIRTQRPGSIETESQVRAIYSYGEDIASRDSVDMN